MEVSPLPIRRSIQRIIRVIETQGYPVQVVGDDLHDHIVKHGRGNVPCSRLRNELVAHYFAGLWQLPVLQASLLKVDPAHVGDHVSSFCQPAFFKQTCFATRFIKGSTEFNRFLENTTWAEKQRFLNREDLLRIALFDLWLSNDDRTSNNPNLLVTAANGGFTIHVMDHEGIFYGNNPAREPVLLSEEDSILFHPAIPVLVGRERRHDPVWLLELWNSTYLCIKHCEQRTDEILTFFPADWQVDVATFRPQLQRLFDEEWLRRVHERFHQLLNKL